MRLSGARSERGDRPGKLHGRRRGRRLRKGRQALVDTLLPQLAVRLPDAGATIDPAALFDPPVSEVWLEVGFGAGEHLAQQAAAHPEVGFVGCEVFINGIASLLRHVDARGLANVRVLQDDARLLLPALPAASLGRVFVLFPDPWPKARHEGRRFISGATLDDLARTMTPGAELRIATDHPVYLRWTLELMSRHPGFAWTARSARDWRTRPDDWPATRYEQKAAAEGRASTYLRYVRRAA